MYWFTWKLWTNSYVINVFSTSRWMHHWWNGQEHFNTVRRHRDNSSSSRSPRCLSCGAEEFRQEVKRKVGCSCRPPAAGGSAYSSVHLKKLFLERDSVILTGPPPPDGPLLFCRKRGNTDQSASARSRNYSQRLTAVIFLTVHIQTFWMEDNQLHLCPQLIGREHLSLRCDWLLKY